MISMLWGHGVAVSFYIKKYLSFIDIGFKIVFTKTLSELDKI